MPSLQEMYDKEVYLFRVSLAIENYSTLDCVTDRHFRIDTCHLLAAVQ